MAALREDEWAREVVRISDIIESRPLLQLEFIKVAVSALRGQPINSTETQIDFYKLHELIQHKVASECTPSVVYDILQSLSFPKACLERIRKNHNVSNYESRNHIIFDLTLMLISILNKMSSHRRYALFQNMIAQALLPGHLHLSRITSRANLLQRLLDEGTLNEDSVPLFLSTLKEVGYTSLSRPLKDFCQRHNIQISTDKGY